MRPPNSVRGAIARSPSASLLRIALAPTTIALFVLSGIGANSLLALGAAVVLVIGSSLLWRPGESPILLFIFGYQWLQASVAIFYANWLGVTVSEVTPYRIYGGNVNLATVLSLLALLVVAVGMRVGAGPWRPEVAALALNVAHRYETTNRWFYLYGAAWLVATTAQSVSLIVPELSQPLVALAKVKWAFFFILAYVTFVRPGTNRIYFTLAFGLEFVLSVGSYFSEFKTVFLFTLFALVAGVRPSVRQFIGLSVLGGALLTFVLTWTAIKGEYRSVVRGPGFAQVVTFDYVDRLRKLDDLVSQLDGEQLAAAFDQLIKRVSYVDFFAVVLETVPQTVPYEGGAIWGDALSRPFMPRLFFQEKSAIDDSIRTRQYTRIGVAGTEQGTSISLGYIAESYIDFGEAGMMLPIFFLGLMLGRIYRWMLTARNSQGILGMGLGTATCFGATALETSITKSFGGLVVTLLVSWLIIRFVAPLYFPWVLISGADTVREDNL